MTSAEGEFCWVAEFCELDAADLEAVAPPEPSIDLSTSGSAEPALLLTSAQYTTGPIEIAQLEAVGHLGSRANSAEIAGVSSGLDSKLKERKPGIFAVGVGILTVCAVAIAALGFRLDTGSLETESAGPLQTASTFAQSDEVGRVNSADSDKFTSTSDNTSDNALAGTSSISGRPTEPISSDPFDSPQTTSLSQPAVNDNDEQTTPTTNNRSATTVRSSLVPPSARRSTVPTVTSKPRTQRQAPSVGQTSPTRSPVTSGAKSGEGALPLRSNSTTTTRRTATTSTAPITSNQPTTTSASSRQTTAARRVPEQTTDLELGNVLQVSLEPPLDRVSYGAAALAADSSRLDLLAVDKITNMEGEGTPGVAVDVFTANSRGLRDRFVSSFKTDADGIYRVEIPTGQGDDDGCYVMVFIAPQGLGFNASGQFREVQLCAPLSANDLPIVRTVDVGMDDEIGESSRSIVMTGGPIYLRGSVNSNTRAAQLEERFQGLLSSAVVADYHVVTTVADAVTGSEAAGNAPDEDQIYFKGRSQELFATSTATPTEALERLVGDLAAVLGHHQQARLRIIVGADADLGETDPSKQMLTDRASAVVELLQDSEISVGRLEARYSDSRLTGRHLHGESMSNQVEFVLIWD